MPSKVYSRILILICLMIISLSGCQAQKSDSAAKVVESYLQALVAEDSNRVSNLVCKDWEEQALTELDAFIGVKATLENMRCRQTGADNDTILVECTGNILATYNNEQQKLPLQGRVYRVSAEAGDWRVCGYK